MKTLKWFSLEWDIEFEMIVIVVSGTVFNRVAAHSCDEQQAFDWLEANGYIERINNDPQTNQTTN